MPIKIHSMIAGAMTLQYAVCLRLIAISWLYEIPTNTYNLKNPHSNIPCLRILL